MRLREGLHARLLSFTVRARKQLVRKVFLVPLSCVFAITFPLLFCSKVIAQAIPVCCAIDPSNVMPMIAWVQLEKSQPRCHRNFVQYLDGLPEEQRSDAMHHLAAVMFNYVAGPDDAWLNKAPACLRAIRENPSQNAMSH